MTTRQDLIQHYGIKGMKWGVRRSDEELARLRGEAKSGDKKAQRQLNKMDKAYEKRAMSPQAILIANNYLAQNLNGPRGGFAQLLNSPKYKDKKLDNWNEGLGKEYIEDVQKMYDKLIDDLNKEIESVPNPSGTKKLVFEVKDVSKSQLPVAKLVDADAKHAEETKNTDIILDLEWKDGKIVKFKGFKEIEHTDIYDFEAVLEHYGIKGMKWGVRRTDEELARARGRRKEKGLPVTPTKSSPDATRKRRVQEKKKERGIEGLTNKDLKDITQRMELEKKFKQLESDEKGKGKIKTGQDKVKEVLSIGATINGVIAFAKSPAGKAIKAGVVKALASAADKASPVPITPAAEQLSLLD